MKSSDYKISLDILESQSQYSLPMKQGDAARVVYITLREGGVPYEIGTDCFAVFSGKKPDGNPIENNCVISGNTIVYEITEQTTSCVGILDCEIKLYSIENGFLTSARFSIIVDKRVVGEAEIESTAEYLQLHSLYMEAAKLKNDCEEMIKKISGINILTTVDIYKEDCAEKDVYSANAINAFLRDYDNLLVEFDEKHTDFENRIHALENDYAQAFALVGGAE